MAAALPYIAAGAVGGSLFGRNKGANPGGQSESSSSGFAALSPEVQKAYLSQYLPSIQNQFTNPTGLPLGNAEQGEFGSQALQELQNYSNQTGGVFPGTFGVKPLAGVEPLHPLQRQAISSFGGGLSGLRQELPEYQELYNENVLEPELAEIERQKGLLTNQLQAQQNMTLPNGGTNSAFGTQLAGLEDLISRQRLNARSAAFQNAQGLRRQTLQDMLNAGGVVQEQGQHLLDYLQPQLYQTTPQGFAANLSALPQSTLSQGSRWGASPGRPNSWAKIGGIAQSLAGLGQTAQGFGGFGGGGVNAHAQPYYGTAPGTYRQPSGTFLNNPY